MVSPLSVEHEGQIEGRFTIFRILFAHLKLDFQVVVDLVQAVFGWGVETKSYGQVRMRLTVEINHVKLPDRFVFLCCRQRHINGIILQLRSYLVIVKETVRPYTHLPILPRLLCYQVNRTLLASRALTNPVQSLPLVVKLTQRSLYK